MKRLLPILTALVVVAALFGMMNFLKATPDQPQATQPPVTVAPMYALVDHQQSPPTRIRIEYEGEQTSYVQKSGLYAAENYDERLSFDQTALKRLFDSCTRLVSRKVIDETPADLALYQMQTPVCVVTMEYADGERHVIRVGGYSPLGDGYYGMVDERPEVYLLLTYDVESFLKKLYDYRSYSLFHDLGDDAENYSLTVRELQIDRGESGKLFFHRRADGPNGESYPIEIHQPVRVNGDEYAFYQNVIQPLFSLKNARLQLVEDLPADLAGYGLDNPQTLWLKDDRAQTRLLIGREEEGRTYLMREGIPAVLSVKASALAFLGLDYARVMDRLVWLYSIDRVQSVTIVRGSRTDVLEVRGGTGFWLNGREVDENGGRAVYRSSISMMYEGRAEESAMQKDPECTLSILMLDGTEHSLSLYALNERHLEVALDGESTGFYVNKSGWTDLVDALERIQ